MDLDMSLAFYSEVISADLYKTTCIEGDTTILEEDSYVYEKYFMATAA
jgi:hypothetical protein